MQVTVNIPDEVAAQVQSRGLSLDDYVQGLVASAAGSDHRLVRLGPGPYSLEEAGAWIRAMRTENRLDGTTIRELIDAGRKY